MFVRRYSRKKSGKAYIHYALVESVRTEAGPRQRVVAHLGELNHDPQRRRQRTTLFYNRQGEAQQLRLFPDDKSVSLPHDPDVVRVRLASTGWTNPRAFGNVWLGLWLWRLLKLDEIVDRHLPRGRHRVRPADVVAIEVINRLCAPCSKFALAEQWYASTGLEDLLGIPDREITKDRFYRTSDALLAAKESIENDLKARLAELFKLDYEVLLYGLTSSYSEGLARRGHRQDHRSDCKQIVLALVVTREGFPVAHYTMAGNTQDGQTVKEVITAVESRFGKSQRVWVIDRGLISEGDLVFLRQPGREYVIRPKRNQSSQVGDESSGGDRGPVLKCMEVLRGELRIRPIWHQYDRRVEGHVMVCMLAYALWRTLDHLAKEAGLQALIPKPDHAGPHAPRELYPLDPETVLRKLAKVEIGDIVLETTDGSQLALRRVARPVPEEARILAALGLTLPDQLSPDGIV